MKKNLLIVIFVVALLSTLGSLYYGRYGDPIKNIMLGVWFPLNNGLEPCTLCRYARILMYPLSLLTLIALIKKDYKIVDYVVIFSTLGMFLDSYHYYLQKFHVETNFMCTAFNPCTAMDVDYFGFLTIPLLALLAFIIITVCGFMIKSAK